MLGYFPDPYPDELFYSICARFSDRMPYRSNTSVTQELFGRIRNMRGVDLPGGLNHLVAALPIGHSCTVDEFIADHTLLPFYAPFLPQEHFRALIKTMVQDGASEGIGRRVVVHSSISPPQWLRRCPVCVIEDKERFGECYWHRLHQVPGVEMCLSHKVALEDTNIIGRGKSFRHEFIVAERAIPKPVPIDWSPWQEVLLRIARDVAWLLSQESFIPNLPALQQRYQLVLTQQGLRSGSHVYVRALHERIKSCYPSELLSALHCDVDEDNPNNWLVRLARPLKSARHPLHHLLLIQLLGYTIATFFDLSPEPASPFGTGPWPCLNKASGHYQLPEVKECHISPSTYKKGAVIGTFACRCGFTYLRRGPDHSPEDRFKRSRILAYGPIWEMRLRKWWSDPTLKNEEIARRLGVDSNTVLHHAVRLGLLAPSPERKSLLVYREVKELLENTQREPSVEPNIYREAWLLAQKEYPEAGRDWLKHKASKVYFWLYLHDREWLQANLPARLKHPKWVDWKQRDYQLAKEVRAAFLRLIGCAGPPRQITKNALAQEVGMGMLHKREMKEKNLTLTIQALDEVVETCEAFAVRRVWWVAKTYAQDQMCPSRRQLLRQAGVEQAVQRWPPVEHAVDGALHALHLLYLGKQADRSPFQAMFPGPRAE